MTSLSRALGGPATLDDFPDAELDRLARLGFDWVWFLGVWQTGPIGREISRNNAEWQREFRELLPDFTDDDVCGSCFAIQRYAVHSDFGGDGALERLRQRIHSRGMRLLLDFVPNHTSPDHRWVEEHPEYYVPGTVEELASEPQNYTRVDTAAGPMILAYGRDPYFAGWPDTLQLNYADPSMQEALLAELRRIATLCDGVRCDMAMLVLPDVFERTWGMRPEPFWPRAIEQVKARIPDSCLWRRSIGTSNGLCSSRVSTTPTINGSTIVSVKGTLNPCAITSARMPTFSSDPPGFWKIMTNRGRLPSFQRTSIAPQRC